MSVVMDVMTEPLVKAERGTHGIHVTFDCRNCDTRLTLDPKRFTVKITAGNVSVAPEWFCPECGAKGSILRSKIRITGAISLPPSGARAANVGATLRADALVIDRSTHSREVSPGTDSPSPEPEHDGEEGFEFIKPEPEPEPVLSLDPEPLIDPDDYTRDELVSMCKREGLAKTGNKEALAARLNDITSDTSEE